MQWTPYERSQLFEDQSWKHLDAVPLEWNRLLENLNETLIEEVIGKHTVYFGTPSDTDEVCSR